MNRKIYPFLSTLGTVPLLFFAMTNTVLAQSVPQVNRLTPLQRQQLARDLVPSGAQDFFNAGHANLEQEIRRLTQPRSPLNEPLLTVRQDAQRLPKDSWEKPNAWQRDRGK